jgi:histidinol-phosphatase
MYMPKGSANKRTYLDFAMETAYLAGRLTLAYFQTGTAAEFKSDDTPVTVADKKAEEFIRQRIQAAYPTHAVIGEEYGESGTDESSHRWIIDPIDGTKSFMRGVPLYAVLIALEIEAEVEVGIAYFPALNEMVSAATGEGCWMNGRRVRVSPITKLDRAIVSFTDAGSFSRHGRTEAWERIQQATYFQAGWGDAYGHCLVATGRVELMLDPIMSVWDCGPFPPILKEAGGYFGDWQGNPTIRGNEAISTTETLLPEVLKLIQS